MNRNVQVPDSGELSGYRRFAEELAREGGRIAARYFGTGVEVEKKADETPVTRADRETEQFIRAALSERFPDHLITGEEYGTTLAGRATAASESSSPYRWVIDPIDGTKSFVHQIPLFTTLIALLYREQPVVGIIHNPILDECASAAVGGGCTLNGEPCRVSSVSSIEKARVHSTDFADLFRHASGLTSKLLERAAAARTWADGYGYLLVATGRADVMLDPVMALWDIAPIGPVVTEAGGRFTAIDGSESWTGGSGLATNGALHDRVLELRDT
ncbi:inositol monophosphatase family protein [Salinispira pacifica]